MADLPPDLLDDLRAKLAAQRAYLDKHGFLYDAPGVELEDLAWAIREIEMLRDRGAPLADVAALQGGDESVSPGGAGTERTYRDHDHTAEDAVIAAFEAPTPENQHTAEVAVALLQRRCDHVLRRLDGDGDLPEYPVHRHNAAETPEDCLGAVLFELAGAKLASRDETLAHGLKAAHALSAQLAEARRIGRWLYEHLHSDARHSLGDVSEWPWLLSEDPPAPV